MIYRFPRNLRIIYFLYIYKHILSFFVVWILYFEQTIYSLNDSSQFSLCFEDCFLLAVWFRMSHLFLFKIHLKALSPHKVWNCVSSIRSEISSRWVEWMNFILLHSFWSYIFFSGENRETKPISPSTLLNMTIVNIQ